MGLQLPRFLSSRSAHMNPMRAAPPSKTTQAGGGKRKWSVRTALPLFFKFLQKILPNRSGKKLDTRVVQTLEQKHKASRNEAMSSMFNTHDEYKQRTSHSNVETLTRFLREDADGSSPQDHHLLKDSTMQSYTKNLSQFEYRSNVHALRQRTHVVAMWMASSKDKFGNNDQSLSNIASGWRQTVPTWSGGEHRLSAEELQEASYIALRSLIDDKTLPFVGDDNLKAMTEQEGLAAMKIHPETYGMANSDSADRKERMQRWNHVLVERGEYDEDAVDEWIQYQKEHHNIT